MIGPLGLILHMTVTAVVGLGVGFRYGAVFAGKGLKKLAASRGLQHEWELLIESDAKHNLRKHEEQKLNDWMSETLARERSK